MRHPIAIVALLAALGLGHAADARMYKWVDDEGNVQYTQHPPPQGKQAEQLKLYGTVADDEEAAKKLDALREKAGSASKDREFATEYTEYMREREARIKQNCEIARQNLRVLENASRVQDRDASGQPYFLDDATRSAKVEETRRQVSEFCGE